MNVMEAMKARRSVRSYLPRKVEAEKLQAVLEAVRLTPSRHNDQNIRVIVVRDEALKKQIREQAQTQPMVEEADVVWCSAPPAALDFVMPCGQYGYVVDMSLATGFALLEAAEQGLDTCIVCAFEEDAVEAVLGIPEEMRVVSMIAMGTAMMTAPASRKRRWRRSSATIIFKERSRRIPFGIIRQS